MEWCDSKVNMTSKQANKFIKIADEFSNWKSTSNLGVEALYLIATLPEEEKQAQLEKVEQGDNPTVRELQEKRNLREFLKKVVAYELELLDYAERLLSDDPTPTHNGNGLLNHERTTRKHKKKPAPLVLTIPETIISHLEGLRG